MFTAVRDYSDSMSLRMFGLALAMTAVFPLAPAAAQTAARSIGSVLDTLERVRAFHETAISPDGRRVAWVEGVSGTDGTTAIFMRALPSGHPPRITAAPAKPHEESGIAWSPDSESLAFLSDAATPHQLQLWRM